MTDYKKLKAFAEELNPEFEYLLHNGKRVIWTFDRAFHVCDSIGRQVGYYSSGNKWNNYQPTGKNLDKWIDETREYWRAKGLPSLQGKIFKNLSGLFSEEETKAINNWTPKGKLYEMPIGVDTSNTLTPQNIRDAVENLKSNNNWYDHYPNRNLGEGIIEHTARMNTGLYSLFAELAAQNYYKDNLLNKTMNDIKNTAKRLLLTEPDKTFVKAGLKDINKEWSHDVRENAREDMLQEYMDSKSHVDRMTEVAKAIIEENK